MDTEMNQTVGVVHSERNASPFQQIMPCQQRDVLYCLHENGCVSVRMQQPVSFPTAVPVSPVNAQYGEVRYDLHGHSETLRISKSCQVYAGALCPASETHVAVLTSEGRILFWEVEFHQVGMYGRDSVEDEAIPTMLTAHPVKEEGLGEGLEDAGELGGVCLSDIISPHWFVPPEGE